jgi:hypothetical protein
MILRVVSHDKGLHRVLLQFALRFRLVAWSSWLTRICGTTMQRRRSSQGGTSIHRRCQRTRICYYRRRSRLHISAIADPNQQTQDQGLERRPTPADDRPDEHTRTSQSPTKSQPTPVLSNRTNTAYRRTLQRRPTPNEEPIREHADNTTGRTDDGRPQGKEGDHYCRRAPAEHGQSAPSICPQASEDTPECAACLEDRDAVLRYVRC